MKRKRLVVARKMCERKKRLTDHIEGLRKRFKELEREEEEFRIVVLKKVVLSSNKSYLNQESFKVQGSDNINNNRNNNKREVKYE
ncbi:MAG TPA: hypothetical protein VMT35_05870 [Ignavibacteriaceae bacterium]|nr:hypothetical protein [Ignavibacteriaceae bacterium]